jgi:hypothetical protein
MTWFDLALDFSGRERRRPGLGRAAAAGRRKGSPSPPGSRGSEPGNGGKWQRWQRRRGGNGNGSDGGALIYVGPQTGLDQLAWVKS